MQPQFSKFSWYISESKIILAQLKLGLLNLQCGDFTLPVCLFLPLLFPQTHPYAYDRNGSGGDNEE